jgi:two-component system cell cycle sensor histidine kinase/response regulator CckA
MKILIVDDNKENLYLLEILLKGNGYQVISAINGAAALEKLRTDGFDMIISDILMPVMDGFQFCRECKMDENLQDIPFIFYTATYVDTKDEELALALGADKFIRKPVEPDEFMSIIRGIIRDTEARKLVRKKPAAKEEREVFKLYSERLVNKLEKKMLDLETEIARRKQVEEQLRLTEERYRLIAENAKDVIVTTDMNLRLTYVSPSIKYLGTRPAEEVMTMSLEELLTPASFEVTTKAFLEELEIAKRQPIDPARSRTLQLEIVRRDGSTVWTETRVSFLRGSEDQRIGLVAVARDITERKQAEQQALVNAKLASVGELVAGVAHEINNPLTGVIGYAQLLAERQDVPQSVKDDLQKIYEESQRTVKIVKNLLGFARQYKPENNLVDINELLERTLELEAYKMRTSNVELSVHLAADLPLILADYNQLQQVILNIITNAQQAMAETKRKGKIMVTTGVIEDYVRISIADNGPGISVENMTNIFDPFFTTKPEGSGSGLGLSVCHGIITEHGGNIYAESTPGKGTTFIIELPIATGEEAVIREKEPAKKKIRQPRRKIADNILIVEDEPAIRTVLTRNLSARGYQVQAVPGGKDALGKLAKNVYDLLLVDLKMPGMSGRELYEAMKKKHPNSAKRVVFITGDVMTGDTTKFLTSTGRPYLVKPFDSKDITGVIEKVLGG